MKENRKIKSYCAYILKRGVCMIIDEYKSDSTIIRFDDENIGTKEENKEIQDILLSLIIKKIGELKK